jgi:hypothetical protein
MIMGALSLPEQTDAGLACRFDKHIHVKIQFAAIF